MTVQGSKVIVTSVDSTHQGQVHVTYQMNVHFESYTLVWVMLCKDVPYLRYGLLVTPYECSTQLIVEHWQTHPMDKWTHPLEPPSIKWLPTAVSLAIILLVLQLELVRLMECGAPHHLSVNVRITLNFTTIKNYVLIIPHVYSILPWPPSTNQWCSHIQWPHHPQRWGVHSCLQL